MGIEPTYSAWEADVLPLNYTRRFHFICYSITVKKDMQAIFEMKMPYKAKYMYGISIFQSILLFPEFIKICSYFICCFSKGHNQQNCVSMNFDDRFIRTNANPLSGIGIFFNILRNGSGICTFRHS